MCARSPRSMASLKKNSAVTAPDRPRDQTTDEISPPPTSLTALAPPALAQPCLSQKTGSEGRIELIGRNTVKLAKMPFATCSLPPVFVAYSNRAC